MAATALGSLALVLGSSSTAQADTRPPLTKAECTASGGTIIPLGLTGVCMWFNADGTRDSAVITDWL
ncbi:hypothetical protein [Streptomyces armeniacus]|uniref:hypothetical protein n=1 Tax=Streptomyces armeniacus TaxID=83291 RepID=UPI001AD7F68F|nr:hypothetical protein [Streptomyces armeniacus]